MRNSYCRTWIKAKKWKIWKMRHKHCIIWNMARNAEKFGKWEMLTVGPGIWRENWKKHGKWEMHNVGSEIWRKHWKTWKMGNSHCRTWSMERKLKTYWKWKTHTVGHEIWWGTLKKSWKWGIHTVGHRWWWKNWKRGKWDTNTLWPGLRLKTLKKVGNEKCTL